MKYLALFLLLGIGFHSKAQVSAIGHTEAQVKNYMNTLNNFKIIDDQAREDGSHIVLYQNEDLETRGFTFNKGMCTRFSTGGKLSDVSIFIRSLADGYTQISDSEWISKNNVYEVKMIVYDTGYMALFSKIVENNKLLP